MESNRQETSLDKMLQVNCGRIDPTNKVIAKLNVHSLESLATDAIFHFISNHEIDDTDIFFGSLPLPQSLILRIKEQFDHYIYTYFVNFIEPTIQY